MGTQSLVRGIIMEEILFNELDKKEHWSKKVFRDKGVSIGDVARALGLTYTYVSGMLTGNIKITDEQELRIKELVDYVNQ
jgi:plasmid maintenance system antidote protein VapI